ncbi:DUF2795 domain-containing protein [Phytoactinopolyspora halotolerans]|uniref:DUF2795 domain-containing protein n=1 Tax=Phytoactinopolyspora halotolerans TaxID=1981512 RepID=A0A6L9S1H9_9ACTN|nr:DUF2795 domain-containing protein [Phytoactinopolyspora halotolerans]NED99354.1 DUF2795 domain-containing protein [Phytoactinopolyspora halotolerans]
MTTTDVERLHRALSDVDFPAGKDDLVTHAERAHADQDTIRVLRAMPPVHYSNMAEVERSVPLGPEREPADQAAQRRMHTHPGLSEQNKDTPGHPIADEVGENRGS